MLTLFFADLPGLLKEFAMPTPWYLSKPHSPPPNLISSSNYGENLWLNFSTDALLLVRSYWVLKAASFPDIDRSRLRPFRDPVYLPIYDPAWLFLAARGLPSFWEKRCGSYLLDMLLCESLPLTTQLCCEATRFFSSLDPAVPYPCIILLSRKAFGFWPRVKVCWYCFW